MKIAKYPINTNDVAPSYNKVKIVTKITDNATYIMLPIIPSLNNVKLKATNTIAVPVSFWSKIVIIGNAIIINGIMCVFNLILAIDNELVTVHLFQLKLMDKYLLDTLLF